MKHVMKKTALAVVLSASALSANAVGFITNGDFEAGSPGRFTSTTAPSWNITSSPQDSLGLSADNYHLVVAPNTIDTNAGSPDAGSIAMWDVDNGGLANIPNSTNGGNFVLSDGAFQNRTLYQTLNGLTIGTQYDVTFEQALAQQTGFDGAVSAKWRVNWGSTGFAASDLTLLTAGTITGVYQAVGGDTLDSPLMSIASHGFSGWTTETLTFTASSTSAVLSFLAVGSIAQPPWLLLDGVTVTPTGSTPPPVSEPETYLLLAMGGLGLAFSRKRKAA